MTKLAASIYFKDEEILKWEHSEEYRKETYKKIANSIAEKLQDEDFFEKHVYIREVDNNYNERTLQFNIEVVSIADRASKKE